MRLLQLLSLFHFLFLFVLDTLLRLGFRENDMKRKVCPLQLRLDQPLDQLVYGSRLILFTLLNCGYGGHGSHESIVIGEPLRRSRLSALCVTAKH